jgi:hypothetical protein
VGEPSTAISVTGPIDVLGDRPFLPSGIDLEDGTISSAGITVGEESTVNITGASRVVGPLTVGGELAVASGSEVTIDELTLEDTASWTIDVDTLAGAPTVEVPFGLVLDGVLTVDLGEELPDPTDLHLVVSPDPQVSFPPLLTGADTGARVQVEDDGIHVYRDTPQWADGDRAEIAGLVVDDAGTPSEVGLRWPAPSGNPAGFEIVRTGPAGAVVIATLGPDARTFVDTDPFSQGAYTVRAIVGRATVTDALVPARANFPAAASCTLAWTRGAGTVRWADAGNWAPHGTAPEVTALGGARAPLPTDHACVPAGPIEERIVSVEAPADVRRLTADLDSLVWLDQTLTVEEDAAIGQLLVEGPTLDVSGDLSSSFAVVQAGGEISVAGELTHPEPDEEEVRAGRWGVLLDDGAVGTASGWTLPSGAFADLRRGEVIGPFDAAGTVELPADADVTFLGEVALTPDAVLDLTLDAPAAPPSVVAREQVTLDGTLDIELLQPLPTGADVALVTTEVAGVLDGEFATVKLTGATTGVTAVVDDAAIRVVREAVVGDCAEVPAVDGLAVEGCWQEGPDDTYTADPDPDDPTTTPAIGDVVLTPEAGSDLVLDLGAAPATLTSTGPVAVGIDVALPARVARWTSTGPIDWTLGGAVTLPTDRFFGGALASAPTLTPVGGRWQATLRLPMPALLGGGVQAVRGTIGADGRLPVPTGTTGARTIAELGRSAGLTVTYADLNRWTVATSTPGTGTAVSASSPVASPASPRARSPWATSGWAASAGSRRPPSPSATPTSGGRRTWRPRTAPARCGSWRAPAAWWGRGRTWTSPASTSACATCPARSASPRRRAADGRCRAPRRRAPCCSRWTSRSTVGPSWPPPCAWATCRPATRPRRWWARQVAGCRSGGSRSATTPAPAPGWSTGSSTSPGCWCRARPPSSTAS